ncbi:glycoside hydrolase family 133 protein [Gonapodya prolifera JEL478]|uniref:Glycoside hydrolase family 133 protein n=1 Tax=Gonapodya prolifera (strain JEL478) TaxID=1344416 RepID=A0A139A531_GONPJ|nr:glycoside hydrolase family 133 protein [Gonapodya prolifera JEL478]|eukprot:KXS11729.1 glycoside hydrolase family 133 protein [Gonapodya prolifera JEL478]
MGEPLPNVIYNLRLAEDGSPPGRTKFIRLPAPNPDHPYLLRFVITAGSSAFVSAELKTNYPINRKEYHRDVFNTVPFSSTPLSDASCTFPITQPGIFQYFVVHTPPPPDPNAPSSLDSPPQADPDPFHHPMLNFKPPKKEIAEGKVAAACMGYVLVDPRLKFFTPDLSANYSANPSATLVTGLDGICIQTYVPKWLPTLPNWPPHFKSCADAGYNMVHFAPLMQRGESNSPYSLYDQLAISDDLYDGKPPSEKEKARLLKATLDQMTRELGILSVTDVVWNHTAHNSGWLKEHPEAGYNLINSPHLRPAYDLDRSLIEFSSAFPQHGLSSIIDSEAALERVVSVYFTDVFPKLELWKYFVVDVKSTVEAVVSIVGRAGVDWCDFGPWASEGNLSALALKDRAQSLANHALAVKPGVKFGKTVDPAAAARFVAKVLSDLRVAQKPGTPEYLSVLKQELIKTLDEFNLPWYQRYDEDVKVIRGNVEGRARWLRLAGHGPKQGPVSKSEPLCDVNFTIIARDTVNAHYPSDALVVANNGWIWNADPLNDFAAPGPSCAYFRREVIPWGDCVKMRYGSKKEDNPYLWDHMERYTVLMASLFDGFRIDNCHSTPIHLAEYLLDAARKVNPDLFVMAELFTGSEEKDIMFVSKLGINALIREAMNAWDPFELSRNVHRYGGQALGSFTLNSEYVPLHILGHNSSDAAPRGTKAAPRTLVVDVRGNSPNAVLMDCTHDNETPAQRRTPEDTLPNAAVVAMASCAIGSVKGYDEIIPELLNVVHESRKYKVAKLDDGIIRAKSILQRLHLKMAQEGYSEIHVHQETEFISIHRKNPVTHDGYLMIARTAFSKSKGSGVGHQPIYLRQQQSRLMFAASIVMEQKNPSAQTKEHINESFKSKVTGLIEGLPSHLIFSTDKSSMVELDYKPDDQGDALTVIKIITENFVPGSVVLFRTSVVGSGIDTQSVSRSRVASNRERSGTTEGKLARLWSLLGFENEQAIFQMMVNIGSDPFTAVGKGWFGDEKAHWPPGLFEAVKELQITDLNIVLYRSAAEEGDGIGFGTYDIPGLGNLAYAGLQGFVSALSPVARNNDLGAAICGNLRAGPWMMDYIVGRLENYAKRFPRIEGIRNWLNERFQLICSLSADLIPKYFGLVLFCAYQGCRIRAVAVHSLPAFTKSSSFTDSLELFTHALAMGAPQMYGHVNSTGLIPDAQTFPGKLPPSVLHPDKSVKIASLAAGLPHFATNHMRLWGRDVFIALRGSLLLTRAFDAAKTHIIAFGSTLRHGLIPNLLDSGKYPRYNARDAAWFWLLGVQDYVNNAPEGVAFLATEVPRRFAPPRRYRRSVDGKVQPVDTDHEDELTDKFVEWDSPDSYRFTSTVADLIFEVLDRHARGIKFREWNAGNRLDEHMKNEGFNIEARVRFEDGTGFVTGGNRFNCGTWMDKMGSSEKAGNRGFPTTPRDGADIEIVGLCKFAVGWCARLAKLEGGKWFPYKGVTWNGTLIFWDQWNEMLVTSFEKHFYIPEDESQFNNYVLIPELVKRKGIYKDTCGATLKNMDYQLRPNLCIAMTVAPELFNPLHAKVALENVKKILLGPLGMKTLDPEDWAYRGFYDNSNDSTDPSVAHGANYHQGPEWFWPMGYFLRSYLHFNRQKEAADESLSYFVQRVLLKPKRHLLDVTKSPFAGLPELTNANGEYCAGSCPTQAWSMGCLLEAVQDLITA